MTEQQATTPPPKGADALKGIGETFQSRLFHGTGNFSVPHLSAFHVYKLSSAYIDPALILLTFYLYIDMK